MTKEIKRIGVTEILGEEIVFYGSWEEPKFLVKDVASWIEHSNPRKMIVSIDEDEKEKHILGVTNSYTQDVVHGGFREGTEVWFLTEDGIYEVLMLSRKDKAKPLKKKIKQYLKNIRKTGGAVEEGKEEDFINNYFPSFSEEVKLSMVQDLLKTNKELKPKADYCDKVLNPVDKVAFKKLATVTDIAKDLGMSGQKLNKILHYAKLIYKQSKSWKLYSNYENMIPEYFDYHITEYNQTLKYTEKGRKFIIDNIDKWKEEYDNQQ